MRIIQETKWKNQWSTLIVVKCILFWHGFFFDYPLQAFYNLPFISVNFVDICPLSLSQLYALVEVHVWKGKGSEYRLQHALTLFIWKTAASWCLFMFLCKEQLNISVFHFNLVALIYFPCVTYTHLFESRHAGSWDVCWSKFIKLLERKPWLTNAYSFYSDIQSWSMTGSTSAE